MFRRLTREIGRVPDERTTLYDTVKRFENPALDPPSLEPAHLQKQVDLSGPTRWRAKLEKKPRHGQAAASA